MQQTARSLGHAFAEVSLHAGGKLIANCRRRSLTLLLTYGLSGFGYFPLAAMPLVMIFLKFDWAQIPTMIVGVPFILLGRLFRKRMQHNWGTVEISQAGLRWTQGQRLRGSWPLSAVSGVAEPIAFNTSQRLMFERERWLMLLVDGQQVPIFFGARKEREWIRQALRSFQLPV